MITRKIYERMKSLYKNFVVLISGESVEPKQMYGLEKQINDVMELIGLYMNQ